MSELSPPSAEAPSRGRLAAYAAAVGAATLALLVVTSTGLPGLCEPLPMAWDEGNAIGRAEGIARWADRWLLDDQRADGPLSREAIAADWSYTTAVEGHPALYGIAIAAGRAASGWALGPLHAARFGPMLLFAVAAGAMFYRLARQYSIVAGLAAAAALVLLPRLFAHAHFALCDGTLTACWVLAWAAFDPARRGWRPAVLFGLLLGMTFSSKATGWLAPLPFALVAVLQRDRSALRALAVGVPVAVVAFVVLNPPLWHNPPGGLLAFFELNLSRAANPNLNISTWFLGRMYNLDHPLPWYNTLFWTAVTVPVGLLLLAGVGLATVWRHRRERPAGLLLTANWLMLIVVRALPGTPPHDGVRMFLPSFAFLAALAGVGCATLVGRRHPVGRRRWAIAGVVALYLGSASSLTWYAPQWLSYYNLAIGGLPGAAALGMEPTYYWDALDRPALQWLDANTRMDEKVQVGPPGWEPKENLVRMQAWGMIHFRFRAESPGQYRWYVVQHRPSGCRAADLWLIDHGRPQWQKTIRRGGIGPWRMTVPLVEVYDYDQFLEARRRTEGEATPDTGSGSESD